MLDYFSEKIIWHYKYELWTIAKLEKNLSASRRIFSFEPGEKALASYGRHALSQSFKKHIRR